jgi:hypothetical protein
MTLLSAWKHFVNRVSCTLLPNAFGPGPSWLRLRPSRSPRPSWCGFHKWCSESTSSSPPGRLDGVPGVLDTCLDDSVDHGPESGPVRKLSLPQGGGGGGNLLPAGLRAARARDQDLIPMLERELSACCAAVMPMLSFS